MGLGGVVLAAGESTRMGRDKALLPWPPRPAQPPIRQTTLLPASAFEMPRSETLLSAAIKALSPFCEMVIVVAGMNEPALRTIADGCAAFVIRNPEPERGQFSSLQIGLREILNRGRDSAMATLVDRPPPQHRTFEKLVKGFDARDRTAWAVIPEFSGKHGHPIVIGREMIEAFLRAPATANAREIEHAHQDRVEYLLVDDAAVTMNINTPEDYAALAFAQPP